MRIVLFLFVSFFSAALLGQTAADSAAVVKQVDSLIQVSRAFTGKRNFDKALEINAAAEKIALEKLGRESAAYGSCCFNRGRVNFFKEDYPEGEKWYLESIAIREKVLGGEHSDLAWSLNNLANLYKEMGEYDKAELLYPRAIGIWRKTLGTDNPVFAGSLNNQANFLTYIGKCEEAEPLLLEAISIFRDRLNNREHPIYSLCLNNLAILYSDLGDFERAEQLQLENLPIREKIVGRRHPDFAQTLNGLGLVYKNLGSYEKAMPMLLEANEIWGATLGKEHSSFLASLINLASCYQALEQPQKAETIYLEVQSILAKTPGTAHPLYANVLNNLAMIYKGAGNFARAESLYLESLSIKEKVFGKNHASFSTGLINLAVLYMDMGNFGRADSLYLQAKSINETIFGKRYPNEWALNSNLARLYELQHDFARCDPLLAEIFDIERARLSKLTAFLSERELANFNATLQFSDNALGYRLFTRPQHQAGNLPGLAFDYALFQKGFLLTTVIRRNLRSTATPVAAETVRQLKTSRRRLATEYAKPIVERKNVAELEAKSNALEKELAQILGETETETQRQVRWQEVQSVLKQGEAAVEFSNFHLGSGEVWYAALVLLPDGNSPVFIPLFEEKQLEALFQTSGVRRSDYVNNLYATAKTGQKTLYNLIWQPLEKTMAGVKTIYFSPSGMLYRINLAAIPTSETANLGDRFHFVELGSTRQLAVPDLSTSEKLTNLHSGEALLWGGIQYEMDSTAIGAANTNLKNELARTRGDLGLEQTDSTSRLACQSTNGDRGGSWAFLPWTEKEINSIAPILTAAGIKATTRNGFAATEEAFKTMGSDVKKPSPRILHIATHGYFFPDPKTANRAQAMAEGSEPPFKISDHPMIRAGLLLAGANHAWKTGKPLRPDLEDGVMTAYEISQMDLSNTELVVLSACETGLGDIQGNEGVYGLQRAFKIAGAKYLIMSLWQVPDFQTQELMTLFYQKWLTERKPLPEAFQAAQQRMREKYEHPYFWAGFVLVE